MAAGDQTDFLGRLRAVLPTGWFPDDSPVLDAVLTGPAYAWSWIHALTAYAYDQCRILTASGVFLDMLALDYLGMRISRASGETDDHFRARIRREILRPKATRAALIQAVQDLTGNAPVLVEPRRPADTGGYASVLQPGRGGGAGFGVAGAYGSLRLHHQAFLTVYRSRNPGLPGINGYGGTIGGYGSISQLGAQHGSIEYVGLGSLSGVGDADIYECVASVIPAATVIWTQIRNPLPPAATSTPRLDIDFTLDVSRLS